METLVLVANPVAMVAPQVEVAVSVASSSTGETSTVSPHLLHNVYTL